MVSKITKIFRYIANDEHQDVKSSPRKRKLSRSLDDVVADCLETPQVKRVRFSPTEVAISRIEESEPLTPINRIANWVKMKASSFSHNFFSRPLQNGVEYEDPGDHEEEGGRPLLNNRHDNTADVRVNSYYSRRPPPTFQLNDRSTATTRQPQKQDKFTHPKLPSSKELARRSIHARRPPDKDQQLPSAGKGRHHGNLHGASPILPVIRNRVEHWHRSHVLRPENSTSQREKVKSSVSSLAPQGSTIHDRLFPVVRIKPGPCYNASLRYSASNRRSTIEECVRLDDRQKYQELLHQFSSTSNAHMGKSVLGEALMNNRTLNRTTEVKVTKPPEHIDRRWDPPICLDLTNSRSSSVSRSQTPVTSRQLSPQTSVSINAVKEGLISTPFVNIAWVEEMKERFESSVRISRRKVDEQNVVYRRILEKKELEKQRAVEKAKILFEEENFIHDVEKEFPLLEPELEPEVEEEDLVELSPEMEDEIDEALYPNPAAQELVKGFKIQLTRGDIQTLNGLNWLNDEVINFYFSMLAERSDNNNNLPKVHTFNTFFYPKLTKDGYNSLRRWTKRVDVFSKDILLVPVHLGVHWCLAIIDFRNKHIIYYDSMNGINDKCLNALQEYLVSEHQDKKKSSYDVSDWELVHAKDIPGQLNGSDCGVFACKFAEYLTRDASISFSQEDMPYFRRRMVWELLHKNLL